MSQLTHINAAGEAHMVDVSAKAETVREARAEAERILGEMGLADKAERVVGTLPFGEERRVGIARAVAMRPCFLLMDEPAAGAAQVSFSRSRTRRLRSAGRSAASSPGRTARPQR